MFINIQLTKLKECYQCSHVLHCVTDHSNNTSTRGAYILRYGTRHRYKKKIEKKRPFASTFFSKCNKYNLAIHITLL